ncbi:MAG: stage V sporulation protein E [Candidatus Komeilibacteria bacterium CG_4_10_14_0_2_um_filter_37_10]|uniref:Probable peptidoglycan glycosyltransferase FtsW n=1 Tax=Candidatus Komeilibacteria bacterium CG_4_10_14_0_2_um_filter_37_10 TaxID=1974470 RepID=A0A2M7VDS3_9BACT|nr:MAG: stage V sporulation protein E [Candidatus Komeilibacteria bacterium CG_4_10_14_0_2_um_filter_37_10]
MRGKDNLLLKFKSIFVFDHRGTDYVLLFSIGLIIIFGLLMLSSASAVVAFEKYHNSYYFVLGQLFKGILPGIILLFIGWRLPYTFWKKYSFLLFVASILFLVAVFIPGLGVTINNSRSWIGFFGLTFQPAEIVKITFLIYLASWLEKRGEIGLRDLDSSTIPFLIMISLIAFLFIQQPDLGSLIVLLAISYIIYFIAGAPMKHLLIMALVGIILMMGILVIKHPDRLQVFFSDSGSSDESYQTDQIQIAIGAGGFWGQGLGHSKQKFRYLPEVQNDSIFAVIAEELGFIVSSLLILTYFLILSRGLKIARASPDAYGRLLATGITIWFLVQAMINFGGMLSVIPLTGLPLPFISYGGTSMAMTMFAFGILLNISQQRRKI